jgi:hypothetical protein
LKITFIDGVLITEGKKYNLNLNFIQFFKIICKTKGKENEIFYKENYILILIIDNWIYPDILSNIGYFGINIKFIYHKFFNQYKSYYLKYSLIELGCWGITYTLNYQ